MLAYRLGGWGQEPQFEDVPIPEPAPGQVLVKIAGAGACHSDLHVMEWPAGVVGWPIPFTLGHENAGWVQQLGAGVGGLDAGEPVAVYGKWGCGRCRPCRLSEENNCERAELPPGGGLGLDGGMAEYQLVPSDRFLVPLAGLDPVQAAPLTDAALTPYHAIKRALPLLVPGSTAVAIGVGGLGHMAIQLLRVLSPARVIAVDTAPDKLQHARELGAEETLLSDPDTAANVRELTRGVGADLVLDFVGIDQTIALAAAMCRSRGELSIVGAAGGVLALSAATVPYDCTVVQPLWGTIVELMEVLELARSGHITSTVERFALADAPRAYEQMRAGTLRGRAVITPSG